MSDKKSKASWMFSQKTKDAAEERGRKQREYRLGSDNFTWEDIEEEDDEEEEIFEEDADSRAARPDAAAPAAALPRERPPTRCFDWMFSSTAKNARKRREEAALQRKRKTNEVKLADDDDSEESNADIQVAILQSIQKEPMEVTHVRVQQPEYNVVDKLFEDEAQNVPTNTPVHDKDSVGEAALAEELAPEVPDDIIEEDETFQRVLMESLQQQQQQQIINPQHALEQLDRLPAIAGIKPLEPVELSEWSNAQSGHENKASLEPEPMETSIDQEQRPDGDDIEKDNGDAEENAPKNEDSSKPESEDVQLGATVVQKAGTPSLIDARIVELLNGKEAESDTSAIIGENDMLGSSTESLYVSGSDDESNQEN